MATVSLGVEAGARGGRVSGGLALVPVVTAETEAVTATATAADQREGLREASGTCWRRSLDTLLVLLPLLSVPGSGKLAKLRCRPEETSTA